jgi:Protein of unknown function (DUF3014)
MKRLWLWLGLIILALIVIGAYFWLHQGQPPIPPPIPVVTPPPVAPPPAPTAPPNPAVTYPVPLPPGMTEVPPPGQAGNFVKDHLTELLGEKNVKIFLQLGDFAHRFVATVDNLGRSLAPPRLWPINPTPGRFTVDTGSDGTVISAKNAARYAPFVAFVDSVDTARAVALYRLLYPLFQHAYEELGYPRKYFNDRLVEVIDLLLQTPEPSGPVKVELPAFPGPLKPTYPWLLYRFSDPDLQGLTSGQKILLRMGRSNELRLKAKLREIHKLIAGQKPKG